MKGLHKILFIVISVWLVTACQTDLDKLYNFDYINPPGKVTAVFDITQDNTGLVSIVPNAEGAQVFRVDFGDSENQDPQEYSPAEIITHNYSEGTYPVSIIAVGITGLKSEYTQDLTVTFKAPENLVVTIVADELNPRKITVKANADFATVFDIYFGDMEDEEPAHVLPDEEISHVYEEAGDYIIKVVAKSAGAATLEYTETISVSAAADPVDLPIDFESFLVNYAFSDFGNVASQVTDNPDKTGINTSEKVAQSVKPNGAETWAGTFLTLGDPIDFSVYSTFNIKVWSPKSGATVKLKVENLTDGGISHEVDAVTTTSNEWELLSFDFSSINQGNSYQKVVVFFDFGNAGDGSVYYFDDIKLVSSSTGSSPIVGTWKVAPEAGSIGVGPGLGDVSWWAIDAAGVEQRACFFDDTYMFGSDGSFKNILGDATWIEGWQGGSDACGSPVAPHDGLVEASYVYDANTGTVTLNGTGAYLGISKAYNGGELTNPADAPSTITYDISFSENNTVMTVDINIGSGWWRFKLIKDESVTSSPLEGIWTMAPEAGSLGVGPGLGDVSWWAIDAAGVEQRTCFFDDTYVFGSDESFKNILGDATWIEGWQGGSDACGSPVAPHDGITSATYSYDENAGTLTLYGKGAFLGIPKAYNGGELANPADAPDSITYDISLSENNTVMIADINIGSGWWRFKLVKN